MKKTTMNATLVVASGIAATIIGRIALGNRRASPVMAKSLEETSPPDALRIGLIADLDHLARIYGTQPDVDLRQEIEGRSESWVRAVWSDLKSWLQWLEQHPAATSTSVGDVAEYVQMSRSAGNKDSTLRRKVSSIATAGRLIGVDRAVTWSDVVRNGEAEARQPDTVGNASLLQALIDTCGDGIKGMRDAAIIALGHAADLKSKEIAQIHTRDFSEEDGKVMMKLPRTAAKRSGNEAVEIDRITVALIGNWARIARVSTGHVFRGIKPAGTDANGPQKITATALTGSGTIYVMTSVYDRAVERGKVDAPDVSALRTRIRNEPLRGVLT